jgi:hypothetical protein
MRRTVLAASLAGLVLLGYLAWPVHSVSRLARAIEARDVATAMSLIHIASVQHSVAQQVTETYLKLPGKGPASPLLHGIAVGAATSLTHSILAGILDPAAFAEFLRSGWPTGILHTPPSDARGLTTVDVGSVLQIYSAAKYRLRRFEVALPLSAPAERRFGLEFRLIQWRWQLADVRLPEHLRLQLAHALAKAQSGR